MTVQEPGQWQILQIAEIAQQKPDEVTQALQKLDAEGLHLPPAVSAPNQEKMTALASTQVTDQWVDSQEHKKLK